MKKYAQRFIEAPKGIMAWVYAYIVAIILDITDFLLLPTGFGASVLSFIEFILLYPVIGHYVLINVVEVVPVLNVVPASTASVIAAHWDIFRKKKN